MKINEYNLIHSQQIPRTYLEQNNYFDEKNMKVQT